MCLANFVDISYEKIIVDIFNIHRTKQYNQIRTMMSVNNSSTIYRHET